MKSTDYLQKLHIKQEYDSMSFYKSVAKRAGRENFIKLSEMFEEIRDDTVETYSFMHSTYDLSLAYVGGMDGSFFKTLFRYFEDMDFIWGKTIADIGCGNGIITCFIAYLNPGSEVYGFDACPAAVQVGEQIAQKLSLSNVHFATKSFYEIEGQYDSVFSSRISHELHKKNNIKYGDNYERNIAMTCDMFQNYANHIANLIKDGGIYITVDRLNSQPEILGLYQALENTGLRFAADAFQYFQFPTVDENEQMPAAAFKKDKEAESELYALIDAFNKQNQGQ